MEVIFFSTHCPKCGVLEKKLKQKNISYVENNNIQQMLALGIKSAPYLQVDGQLYDFSAAWKWLEGK